MKLLSVLKLNRIYSKLKLFVCCLFQSPERSFIEIPKAESEMKEILPNLNLHINQNIDSIDLEIFNFKCLQKHKLEISIQNISGETIYCEEKMPFHSFYSINTFNFEKGMYLIKIKLSNNQWSQRIYIRKPNIGAVNVA